MRLKDKLALVTGAGSGIGRDVARRFAAEGARVVAADVDPAGLEETARGSPGIVAQTIDVAGAADVERGVAAACSILGGLDVLVCAAGVVGSRFGDGPAAECREEAWDHVMRINLKGVWLCCKHAIPAMLARGRGSIVTISSVTALCPPMDFFRSHAYITSKGGVITLTRCIASYYARAGIRANVIAPGMIDTPMSKRMQGVPEIMEFLADRQPLGRLGASADIASAALFLASEESRFITGVALPVDGGWSNHG